MKQKTVDDSITKKDLFSAFKEFRVLIRKDFHDKISASEIRTDIKLEKLELRMDDKAKQYRNEILTRFDAWSGKLENARLDRTLTTQQIDDLKKRVTKLESAQN